MELVIVNNGKATTTSMVVAEYFGKRHADVIRSIESMLQDADIFSRRNFALAEYTDEQGKPRPMYELDRDGFTLLAMGFTGKQALQFKLSYIDAFNKAEETLKQITAQLPTDPIMAQLAVLQSVREQQLSLQSGVNVLAVGISETRNEVNHLKQNMRVENWQQCNIKSAVHQKAAQFQDLYPASEYGDIIRKIWRYFKNKFNIPRYQELPAMAYEEAMQTIHNLAIHNLAGL